MLFLCVLLVILFIVVCWFVELVLLVCEFVELLEVRGMLLFIGIFVLFLCFCFEGELWRFLEVWVLVLVLVVVVLVGVEDEEELECCWCLSICCGCIEFFCWLLVVVEEFIFVGVVVVVVSGVIGRMEEEDGEVWGVEMVLLGGRDDVCSVFGWLEVGMVLEGELL